MSEIETGGPAFPIPAFRNEHGGYAAHSEGMCLRDYFAAKAMQTCISVCANDSTGGISLEAYFAQKAYDCADAMLAARSKA